jgi:LEA14-like dessication related protein
VAVIRHMSRSRVTEEILRIRLAKKVRTSRTELRLTLRVAAGQAKMHWRHWQKIEAAEVNVTLQMLVRLGAVLGVDPGDLIRA